MDVDRVCLYMRQYIKNLIEFVPKILSKVPSSDGGFVIGEKYPHQFVIGQFSITNGLSLGGGFNPIENY